MVFLNTPTSQDLITVNETQRKRRWQVSTEV